MKKIISATLIFLSLSFWGCKKEIVEPKKEHTGKSKIYIKVDDQEFFIENKMADFFSLYSGNIGSYYDSKSRYYPEFVDNLNGTYHLSFSAQNNRMKKYEKQNFVSKIYMDMNFRDLGNSKGKIESINSSFYLHVKNKYPDLYLEMDHDRNFKPVSDSIITIIEKNLIGKKFIVFSFSGNLRNLNINNSQPLKFYLYAEINN